MHAVQIMSYGQPSEVVEHVEVAEPEQPGSGEVLIGMEFAPINVNDLLLLTGKFPVHPPLPAFVGNEGVGKVVAVGADVTGVKVGDRVIPPLYSGTWRERMLVPASSVFVLPAGIDPKQAAMLRINPPTAALLLSEYAQLLPGDWIVQNAANSGVGRAVIAFAKARGLKTVNLVRRSELVEEIRSLGGDLVFVDDHLDPAEVARAIDNAEIRLALDGVCGPATARLAGLLGKGGVLVQYAQMSGDKTAPGNFRLLMAKNLTVKSFYQNMPQFASKIPGILRQAVDMVVSGELHQEVSAVYPLREIKSAVEHVTRGGRVLVTITSED